MNFLRIRLSSVALLAALTWAACSGAGKTGAETSPTPAADSTAELEAIYWARADSARMRFTEADVHFMTGMIGHHGQALVMADHAGQPPLDFP